MIKVLTGNIFTTQCKTIVNTVNCVGVMGAGIAYEFRLRYPAMYKKYQELCEKKLFKIGSLWIYNTGNGTNILNFPTKFDWKHPSKIEYLEKGLQKFVDTYTKKNIHSIAFPLLGASNGGLTKEQSYSTMEKYLNNLDIEIEIWHFDPNAQDDLFMKFQSFFQDMATDEISKHTGINRMRIDKIKNNLDNETINSMSSLLKIRGIGDKTLEKSFKFMREYNAHNCSNLFG